MPFDLPLICRHRYCVTRAHGGWNIQQGDEYFSTESVVSNNYIVVVAVSLFCFLSNFFLLPWQQSLCKTCATATMEAMMQLHVLMASPPEWSIVSYPTNNCWTQAFSLPLSPFFCKMLYILVFCACGNQNNDLSAVPCEVLHKYSASAQMVTEKSFFRYAVCINLSPIQNFSLSLCLLISSWSAWCPPPPHFPAFLAWHPRGLETVDWPAYIHGWQVQGDRGG